MAIAGGQLEGLAEAYDRHGRRVFSMALQVCGTELAATATQAAFMRLWRTPLVFDSSRGSLRTCLVAHAQARAVVLLRAANSRRTSDGTARRAVAAREPFLLPDPDLVPSTRSRLTSASSRPH
jgi:DNA-directed RNA polymerase specialized sigma24 family protein